MTYRITVVAPDVEPEPESQQYSTYEDAAAVLGLLRDFGKDGLTVTLDQLGENNTWHTRATVRTGGGAS